MNGVVIYWYATLQEDVVGISESSTKLSFLSILSERSS